MISGTSSDKDVEKKVIEVKETISNKTIQPEQKLDQNNSSKSPEIPISKLEIAIPTYNALRRGNIDNISDMIDMDDDDFLALRNFGPQKLDDLKSALGKMGIQIPIPSQRSANIVQIAQWFHGFLHCIHLCLILQSSILMQSAQ